MPKQQKTLRRGRELIKHLIIKILLISQIPELQPVEPTHYDLFPLPDLSLT